MRNYAIGLSVLALAASTLAQAQATGKVGVINIQSAIASSKDGQKAAAELETKSAPKRKTLETKLEDRRQRVVLTQSLAGLDAALTRKDAAIKAAVSDASFAQDLITLTGYEGLVFESRLADFARSERTAKATVQVRHALKVFPERTLTLAYDLTNADGKGWIIAGAKLVSP